MNINDPPAFIEFECDQCGKLSGKKQSEYARTVLHFCSQPCYQIYRKEHDISSWYDSNRIYPKGMYKSKLYIVWSSMNDRCYTQTHHAYSSYGSRGITVSSEWSNFMNFYNDMHQSYKKGLTIERIDNNKGYSKENCRWATVKEQVNNRRVTRLVDVDGVVKPLMYWIADSSVNQNTVRSRLRMGWTPKKALGLE